MALKGGWAGTILRVNLTTGQITRESTEKYTYFIGGMGIGYKVMWDEVPAGTHPFAEENRIIFAVGPLTGTGAMSSGRTNVTSLLASNPFHGVSDSHMGGHFAVEMKYAGYDAIIIQGKSEKPVWLRISDQDVNLEDASMLWGHGTFDTIKEVTALMGKNSQVAAIGQAGEHQVNLSVIRTGSSHSAGGHGGVMGSKMLKAIGIEGTGSVKIAGDRNKWHQLNEAAFGVVGANNQHVVPSTPQPWAEYHHPGSRWTAKKGLMWGAAEYPIETGECAPEIRNKIGYRTMKAVKDLGPAAEKYTVRMGGCASCPVRCHSHLKVPELKEYGVSENVANTCMGFFSPWYVMGKYKVEGKTKDEATVIGRSMGAQMADDYGVWCNYGQIGRDFNYALKHGYLEKVLPHEEYDSLGLDKFEAGDISFFQEFYRRIAFKEGELATLGEGACAVAEKWGFGEDYWTTHKNKMWSRLGYPIHHSSESNGVVGAVISAMFNRDAQCHTHQNLLGSGLPVEIQQEIAAELWGEGAIDQPAFYTPANEAKAKFTKWSLVRNVLHDSLTLCNWLWPMTVSPLKERGYRGDTSLESKFFSMATGFNVSEEDLDKYAERVFTLHRALCAKQMNSKNLRADHDEQLTGWQFDMDPDKKPFSEGTIKLDREDYSLALSYFYKEMGWDEKTGMPTRATLDDLELSDVADELQSLGLLG